MATLEDEDVIFNAALEYPPGEPRAKFLDGACRGNPAFRRRMDELLGAYREGDCLLPPAATTLLSPLGERPGDVIGPYKLLEQIGEGGMGLVFMAEQTRPLRRRVALKIIRPGLDTRAVIARFEAERQALALMDHPNIARVYDAGATHSGRPYFVMELVRGAPITDYCRQRNLALPARLELFIDVCQAVQHAHQKGVIHRDLKPTNILVSQSDVAPVAKVIDFGVAKATTQPLADRTLFTAFSQIIGTPLYMSPEQADVGNQDVDTRSDVYSLGVVLYELLVGATPFDAERLRRASPDEMRRILREEEPPRPSTRATTAAVAAASTVATGPIPASTIDVSALKGDLDWIVMKALDKQRTRRYQSAALLADDVAAYLRHDAVTARPPTPAYLLRKTARKYRVALVTASAIALALVVGSGLSLWQASEAFRAKRLADASLAGERQARAEATSRAARLRRELYAGDMANAWQAWNDGEANRARAILARYHPAASGEDLREFAWHYLNAHCDYQPALLGSHPAPILAAAASPDGATIVSADRAGQVIVWDVVDCRQLAAWNYSQQEVTTVAFSPDGRTLATAGQDATIRLWNVADWSAEATLRGHEHTVCSVCWSPDGRRLASGARDHSIRIWNVATPREEKVLLGNEDVVRCVRWLPDGSHVVAAVGGAVRQWRTSDWTSTGELARHAGGILALAVSRDGRYLASGGYSTDVLITDLHAQQVVAQAASLTSVWSLSFSPDGRLLLGSLDAGGPCTWQLSAAPHRLELLRFGLERRGPQRAAFFDSTGDALIIASEAAREIRVWDSAQMLGRSVLSFPEPCYGVALNRKQAVGAQDSVVILRQLPDGEPVGKLTGHSAAIDEGALSPSGRLLATHAADDELLLWDLDRLQLLRRLTLAKPLTGSESRLQFSADERLLAATSNSGGAQVWSLPAGQRLRDLHLDVDDGTRLAFAPDGAQFATVVAGRGGALWNSRSGEQLGAFGHDLKVWDLCYSPDGSRLYGAAGLNGAVGWDVPTGREVFRLTRHRGQVDLVAVSPDGQTLATAATDNSVRLWHIPTGRALFTLMDHVGHAEWIQFASPRTLLVGVRYPSGAPNPFEVYVFGGEHAAGP